MPAFSKERSTMQCEDVQFVAPLYISGELDGQGLADVERHIAGCASCRLLLHQQQESDTRIREAILAGDLDCSDLRMRILSKIRTEQRSTSPRTRRHSYWRLAVAASAVLLAFAGVYVARSESFSYVAACYDHTEETASSSHTEWKTKATGLDVYVAGRVGSVSFLKSLPVAGYQLSKAKECLVGNRLYVHLVYDNGTDQMSMYVTPRAENGLVRWLTARSKPSLRSRTETGLEVTIGNLHGERVILVGALSAASEQQAVNEVLEEIVRSRVT